MALASSIAFVLLFIAACAGWLTGVQGQQLRFYATKTSSQCFSIAGVPRLEFNCAAGEMIVLRQAFQGVGADPRQCSYERRDCLQPMSSDTETKLRDECIGRPQCSIAVSVAWMRNCNAYSVYNYAVYQCIPESDILDICQANTVSVSRLAFLKTPGYPSQYPPNQQCQCNASTDQHQRILLKFSDASITWSQGCSDDVIEVLDGATRMPRCGRLPWSYNMTSRTHTLSVRLRTNGQQQDKGALVALEALGNMDITCGPASVPPTTMRTTRESTETEATVMTTTYADDIDREASISGFFLSEGFFTPGVKVNTPSEDYYDYYDGFTEQPHVAQSNELSALASIIVGIVLLSLVLLGMAFVAIWLKRRRHKEQISRLPEDAKFPKLQHHKQRAPPVTAATAAEQIPSPPPPPPPPPPVLKKSNSPESSKSWPKDRPSRINFNRSSSACEQEISKPPQHRGKREGHSKRSKQRGHGGPVHQKSKDGKVYADIV